MDAPLAPGARVLKVCTQRMIVMCVRTFGGSIYAKISLLRSSGTAPGLALNCTNRIHAFFSSTGTKRLQEWAQHDWRRLGQLVSVVL